MKNGQSLLLKAALAGMVLASTAAFSADEKAPAAGDSAPAAQDGKCHGINTCKGKGECGGKDHGCAGKNSCKGKGWMKMSDHDCTEKKGTFEAGAGM